MLAVGAVGTVAAILLGCKVRGDIFCLQLGEPTNFSIAKLDCGRFNYWTLMPTPPLTWRELFVVVLDAAGMWTAAYYDIDC